MTNDWLMDETYDDGNKKERRLYIPCSNLIDRLTYHPLTHHWPATPWAPYALFIRIIWCLMILTQWSTPSLRCATLSGKGLGLLGLGLGVWIIIMLSLNGHV